MEDSVNPRNQGIKESRNQRYECLMAFPREFVGLQTAPTVGRMCIFVSIITIIIRIVIRLFAKECYLISVSPVGKDFPFL